MKVRIGVGLTALASATDGEHFGSFVDELERLRFDSLWLSERATAPSPEPMVGLAFAAGRTTKLKFGTSVQVLPELEVKTARTDGPRTSTPATAPMM